METTQDIINRISKEKYRYPEQQEKPTNDSRNIRLTKGKPLISAIETPDQIIDRVLSPVSAHLRGDVYRSIAEHLISYQMSGFGWTDYAKNIQAKDVRNYLAEIISECRRQGYIGIFVTGKEGERKIRFATVIETRQSEKYPINHTLCTMCKRKCSNKDKNGVLEAGVKKCWEVYK